MIIFGINFSRQNSRNTNFNSRVKYKVLTQVPKTPCAICGGTTITGDQFDKISS